MCAKYMGNKTTCQRKRKVSEVIKARHTSISDSNQKSQCFHYPSSPWKAPSNRANSCQNGKASGNETLVEARAGRRRSTVTSLNQRMDELWFRLAFVIMGKDTHQREWSKSKSIARGPSEARLGLRKPLTQKFVRWSARYSTRFLDDENKKRREGV